jgi:DNA-binding response OmpR family regulator
MIDINLGPKEKGYDLIETVRKLANHDVPVIICSGSQEREVISHCLEMGANDYLLKTVESGDFSRLKTASIHSDHRTGFYSIGQYAPLAEV